MNSILKMVAVIFVALSLSGCVPVVGVVAATMMTYCTSGLATGAVQWNERNCGDLTGD